MVRKDDLNRFVSEYEHIYSTVPEYLKLTRLSAKAVWIKRQQIKMFLFEHKGKSNAVPLNQIAKILNFSPNGNSGEFRFLATKILEEELFPIVSGGKGYFYPLTRDEIMDNIKELNKKIDGMARRQKALSKIVKRDFGDIQNSLDKY